MERHTYNIGDAPKFIKTLLKVINSKEGLSIIEDYFTIVWEGNVTDGIRYGIGETQQEAIQAIEKSDTLHKLFHYQEEDPKISKGENNISVYYDQDGLRPNNIFYGLSYDIEHGAITKFHEGPITLLQLHELVDRLDTVSYEGTGGIALLYTELGTPLLERVGHTVTYSTYDPCNDEFSLLPIG